MQKYNVEETIVERERVFKAPRFDVERTVETNSLGEEHERYIVSNVRGASVLALDDEENIYLVEQYRVPPDGVTLELPSGLIDPGEKPIEAAKRELREECGIVAKDWEYLFTPWLSPGFSTETTDIFVARNLSFCEQDFDDGELINVVKMPFSEFLVKVRLGEIFDSHTIATVLLWKVLHVHLSN